MKGVLLVTGSLFLVSFFTGCVEPWAPQTGNYQGSLIIPAVKPAPGEVFQRFAVSGDITQADQSSLQIVLTGYPKISSTLVFSYDIVKKTVTVNGPDTPFQNIVLHSVNGCFAADSPIKARLCAERSSVDLEATSATDQPLYSLKLEYFGKAASEIVVEKPQNFTLDEAVAWAMKMDFNTRIEFEHVMQARWAAIGAFLNLAPHYSGGVLTGLQQAPGGGFFMNACNLAPFLLPSNWILAGQNVMLAKAEKDALALMRGAAGLQIETLAYAIDHDSQALNQLIGDIAQLYALRPAVQNLETKGLIPAGTASHYDSMVYSLGDASLDLQESLAIQQQALSQAMGFVNPQAVPLKLAVPDLSDGMENNPPLSLDTLGSLALARSIEIRQQDTLVGAAKLGVVADYFGWLDPAADVSHSLGFGLGATIMIDRSNVRALQTQEQQVASIFLQSLGTAIAQYNHALEDHWDSRVGLEAQQARMKTLIAQISSGQSVSPTELTTIPADLYAWQVHLLDAIAEYRTSKATIDRIMLQGYYSNLNGSFDSSAGTGSESAPQKSKDLK